MTPDDAHIAVAQQVRRARSSFYWPMHLQTRAHRDAIFTLYAFARILDDIADGELPLEDKQRALDGWRTWFTNNKPPRHHDAISVALFDVIQRFDLPDAPFLSLISGMEADINGPIIAPSWPELETYCGQVAVTIGELCLAIWGWRGSDAGAFAAATGEALQLTNILRDVNEDAHLGRLYVPDEALRGAGIDARDPQEVITDPRLRKALNPVVERAAQKFELAHTLWPRPAAKSLTPAWVMLKTYEALFRKVQASGIAQVSSRIRLSKLEKLRHVATAYLIRP